MKSVEIASLSLKISGLYCFIQSIPFVRALLNAITFQIPENSMRFTMITGASVSMILFILLGSYLIIYSDKIALKITPVNNNSESNQKLDSITIQAIAFSIVGVVIIAMAIPKLFQICVNTYAEQQALEKVSKQTIAFGIGIATQFIIGLLLFFGGFNLSNFWHKFINRLNYERNLK